MVAPIILVATLAGAALSGVSGKNIYDAHKNNNEAKSVNADANTLVANINLQLDAERQSANEALQQLGKLKIDILNKNIENFIENFQRIKNVDFEELCLSDDANKLQIEEQAIEELKLMSSVAKDIATGIGAGATIGAVMAFGAYSGTMCLGVASTGTAIATLNGVAASNATLAFLGGGSIAVGGAGVAGGLMILGGLVTIPALTVFACFTNNQAKKNKEEAYINLAKAQEYVEAMELVKANCRNVTESAKLFGEKLKVLRAIFTAFEEKFEDILCYTGANWAEYTTEQKNDIAVCLTVLKALKAMIGHSLLNENGEVNELEQMIQQCNELEIKYK